MGASMGHLANRELSKGWNAWLELVSMRKLQHGALARMKNRQLSGGWNAWVEEAALQAEFKQVLQKSVAFLRNSKLPGAWNAWLELMRMQEEKRRCFGHLRNRELSKGLNAWAEMVAMQAEFMQRVRKGLGYMMHRHLALGFAGWRDFWQDQLRKRASMQRFKNQELSKSWNGWRDSGRRLFASAPRCSASGTASSRSRGTRGPRRPRCMPSSWRRCGRASATFGTTSSPPGGSRGSRW